MTISSIGLSRILEEDEPELALRLFPINVEAVRSGALTVLRRDQADTDMHPFDDQVARFLSTHAGDARLYSLIGEIRRRAGAEEDAFAAFEQALALSKTEVDALQWTLQRSLDQGDYAGALDQLDILFRRWPNRVQPLAPIVLDVFSDPGRYPDLLSRLEENPPWRRSLIAALSREPDALSFLARIVQDLAAGPAPAGNSELSTVLSALLGAKRYDLAHLTFIFTLSPAEQEVAGHIHNGRFLLRPTGRPFDWQIRDHPGLTMQFPGESQTRGGDAGGLRLQFNNTPVRNLSVRQTLALPPGAYAFGFTVSAADARLPKGLLWRIACVGSNRIVAEAAVEPGAYGPTPATVELLIPGDDCPAQTLHLATKAIGENWNDRYSGSVTFNDFRITAVGS